MDQEPIIDPGLLHFATERQAIYLEAVNKYGGFRPAAAILEVHHTSIMEAMKSLRKSAAIRGYAPEYDMTHAAPDPFVTKGVSTLYDGEGKPKLQWHKTSLDKQRQYDVMVEAIESMCKEIPRKPKIKPPKDVSEDLMNVYTMTDCHMGMLAWDKETGENWDIYEAERVLSGCFEQMVLRAPQAKRCVIAQLGDWLHYDSLEAVTPTSKHILDADTRFAKLVNASIRVLRHLVDVALQHHEEVVVLMAEGNHDMASSVWLRGMFNALYEKEPRVRVITDPLPYYCVQHGKTMLAWHHGHLKRPGDVMLMMADQFAEIWGQTKYRYIHLGDKHHLDEKEHNGVIVTQHPTLAARDAYAARHGWRSVRSARAITYHHKHGEVFRNVVVPEMLE